MTTNEDFKTYSTRARSTQSLLNHDTLVLQDYTLAEHLILGMLPELKSTVRIHATIKEDNFDYNDFKERRELLYQDLVVKKVILRRQPPPSFSCTPTSTSTRPSSEKKTQEDFFWKISAYLDSAGLCHYCKKQCGSEYRQCTGILSRERIVFPPGFKAPPKPANYVPPRAKLANTAGKPVNPPAGRPARNNVAATTFPEHDSTTITAFEEIDREL